VGGAAGRIVNGLIALVLALAVWRLTGSFLGWLVLFTPGSLLVIAGVVAILRGED
jgi:hypothetical protein